jgi:hypothetical protein
MAESQSLTLQRTANTAGGDAAAEAAVNDVTSARRRGSRVQPGDTGLAVPAGDQMTGGPDGHDRAARQPGATVQRAADSLRA